MKHCRWPMVMILLAALACPARAGIFSKRAKPNPAERVPALITTLRVDLDEHKRVAAAEELRQYDPAVFAEIIPTLADVAQHDPKAGVRLEAIQSLAKFRPISHQAGLALEQATHDEALKVRMQARTLLFQYHLAGYRANKTPDLAAPPMNVIRTDEPPLAPASEDPPITNLQKAPFASPPDAGGRYRGEPPAPIVSVPAKPASQFASGPPGGTAPRAKSGLADGRAIGWAPAGPPPKSLPHQPAAVPLDSRSPSAGTARILDTASRPSSLSSAKPTAGGPRPLPNGPAKPAGTGPKPLPEGPAETPVEPAAKSTNEPPLAPADEEGPELSPPN